MLVDCALALRAGWIPKQTQQAAFHAVPQGIEKRKTWAAADDPSIARRGLCLILKRSLNSQRNAKKHTSKDLQCDD
jgi:hypothetical protein